MHIINHLSLIAHICVIVLVKVRFVGWQDEKVLLFRKRAVFEVESDELIVQRRADEFEKLLELLEEYYPSQLIPPLPSGKEGKSESWLQLVLQALCDHAILSEDEYLRLFLSQDQFVERVPMIKNVDGPIAVRKEYFSRGNIVKRVISGGSSNNISKDLQYQRIMRRIEGLRELKDKFRQLVPLFDRLEYERREVIKAANASDQSIRTLLYMNKSERLYAEDQERPGVFLRSVRVTNDHGDMPCFLNFCIKYLESVDKLVTKLNRFRGYLSGKRESVAEQFSKLERLQCVGDERSKPSFDLIYKTKLRHEQMLEEMAVVEVTYEKYSELVEKELDRLCSWIQQNFQSKLANLYTSK